MSHFYGTLNGARGEATRCGSKASGLVTYAASWDGAVSVNLTYDERTEKNMFEIYQRCWKAQGVNQLIARGTVGEILPTPAGGTELIRDLWDQLINGPDITDTEITWLHEKFAERVKAFL